MSTWNSITINEPGDLTVETLPTELTSDGEIWEWYEAYSNEGAITIEGHSKYSADEAKSAMRRLSRSTGRITHFEEWDDDEVGQSLTVYENGAVVHEQGRHSELVPDNLAELVKAGRDALSADTDSVWENGRVTRPMRDALRALVEALEARP